MTKIRAAVYLGSKNGNNPIFLEEAEAVGKALALGGIAIVYGGTNVGTMKALADGALEAGGQITGVIPERFRSQEFEHNSLSELIRVRDLAERKQLMESLSNAAVILPGSYGTMDELFEYAVNNQLQGLDRPIFVYNLLGFYEPLRQQLEVMEHYGLLTPELKSMFHFCDSAEQIVSQLKVCCHG